MSAAIGLSLLATGMQAYSNIQEGKATAEASNINANINEANARTAAFETANNENIARRQLRQQLSRQIAAQGEAGISGSTFANLSYNQSVSNGEADVLNLRYKGLAEMNNYRNTAILNRFSARTAKSNAFNSMYTTLIGGAAQALYMGNSKYGWTKTSKA